MAFLFEIGKTYQTLEGGYVEILGRTYTKSYECLVCSDGRHRYDRSDDSSDAGRVTGTCPDYSDPHNLIRPDIESWRAVSFKVKFKEERIK